MPALVNVFLHGKCADRTCSNRYFIHLFHDFSVQYSQYWHCRTAFMRSKGLGHSSSPPLLRHMCEPATMEKIGWSQSAPLSNVWFDETEKLRAQYAFYLRGHHSQVLKPTLSSSKYFYSACLMVPYFSVYKSHRPQNYTFSGKKTYISRTSV